MRQYSTVGHRETSEARKPADGISSGFSMKPPRAPPPPTPPCEDAGAIGAAHMQGCLAERISVSPGDPKFDGEDSLMERFIEKKRCYSLRDAEILCAGID